MRRPISPHSTGRLHQGGYALLLMLVMVTMGILFTLVSQVSLVGMKWGREQRTSDALLQAKEALIGYAITYRDSHSGDVFGYLPCPDIDGDGSGDALSLSCGGGDGRAVIGLLPYKQLGLASNQDADGNCLWYAVSGTFKASANSTSPYNLPIPMNWDTQGQIEVRDANNNVVTQPNDANGGAAAVIFSVGAPFSSQSRLSSTSAALCGISSSAKANVYYVNYIDIDPAGTDPKKSQPFPGSSNGTIRVTQGSVSSNINNDELLFITPKEIFGRIIARSDFATFINSGIGNIQGALNGAASLPAPISGNLPPLPTAPPISVDTSFYNNWKNNFRYLACTTAGTYCYTIQTQSCDGALVFSGQSLTGGPRPTTAALDAYFTDALSLVNNGASAYSGGAAAYSDSNRSADVVVCLKPLP